MDKSKMVSTALLATGVILGLGLVAGRGKLAQGAVAFAVIMWGAPYAQSLAAKVPV